MKFGTWSRSGSPAHKVLCHLKRCPNEIHFSGLSLAGVTYQWLLHKVYQVHVGRGLERSFYDLVGLSVPPAAE